MAHRSAKDTPPRLYTTLAADLRAKKCITEFNVSKRFTTKPNNVDGLSQFNGSAWFSIHSSRISNRTLLRCNSVRQTNNDETSLRTTAVCNKRNCVKTPYTYDITALQLNLTEQWRRRDLEFGGGG